MLLVSFRGTACQGMPDNVLTVREHRNNEGREDYGAVVTGAMFDVSPNQQNMSAATAVNFHCHF